MGTDRDNKEPASNAKPPTVLSGVRVVEFSHMVMGPSCGLVLADLGADVIKVEPTPDGDNTRRLSGAAIGFHPTFNRNKRSLAVDLGVPEGLDLARKLISTADVVVENFRPGAMDKRGLGYKALATANPRLIYCACKGFLPGPYDQRAALDEVVQMMGGLAYMTGPPGRPLRAGASVNDIMGGVFAAVAILAALRERDRSGKGGLVQSGLFETNVMFVAQHMAWAAIDGRDPPSFGDPALVKPWPIYDIFESSEPNEQVFVGVVTDTQWREFCTGFDLTDLLLDPTLATMPQRASSRARILSRVEPLFRQLSKADIIKKIERLGLPVAPVAKPSDMFSDPHLLASGGLLSTDMTGAEAAPGGAPAQLSAGLPALPIMMFGRRTRLLRQPPRVGEHSVEIARALGFTEAQIQGLLTRGSLVSPSGAAASGTQSARSTTAPI